MKPRTPRYFVDIGADWFTFAKMRFALCLFLSSFFCCNNCWRLARLKTGSPDWCFVDKRPKSDTHFLPLSIPDLHYPKSRINRGALSSAVANLHMGCMEGGLVMDPRQDANSKGIRLDSTVSMLQCLPWIRSRIMEPDHFTIPMSIYPVWLTRAEPGTAMQSRAES